MTRKTAKSIPSADTPPIETGVLWSIHQFGFETGRTRETIRRRIAKANTQPGGTGPTGHPLYRCREVLPLLYGNDDEGNVDPEKLDPFSRKSHYQAEAERRKLMVEAKDLVTREDYVEEMARVLRLLQQFADTVPDVLERDCGLTPDQVARVEKQCDELRNSLAEDLSKFEAEANLIAEMRNAAPPPLELAPEVPEPAETPVFVSAAPEAPLFTAPDPLDSLFG